MAYSYALFTISEGNRTFPITFPFISPGHIFVAVDGVVVTDWVFLNTNHIQLQGEYPDGATVKVFRVTPKDKKLIDFKDGSTYGEKHLDMMMDQTLFVVQENLDALTDQMLVNDAGEWEGAGRVLSNIADPKDDSDVATAGWVKSLPGANISEAIAAANQAKTARDEVMGALPVVENRLEALEQPHDHDAAYVKLEQIGTAPDQIPTNADIVIPPYKVVKPQTILEAPDVFLRNISKVEIDPTKTIPVHTTYASDFGTASASNEYKASYTAAAWHAVKGDGWKNYNDYLQQWLANATTGWWKYAFSQPQIVYGVTLTCPNYPTYTSSLPKNFTIECNGQVVKTVTDSTGWAVMESRTFMFDSPVESVNEIRINVTANNGGSSVVIGNVAVIFGTKNPVTIVEDPTQVLATHSADSSVDGTIYTTPLYASSTAWHVLDKNLTTGINFNGLTGTITYVFNQPRYILGYVMGSNHSDNWPIGRAPKNWTVRVGVGTTPDTIVDTQINQTWAAMGMTRDYTLANPLQVPVRSISFQITANNGDANYTGTCEIGFKFGKAVMADTVTGEKQVEYMTGAAAPEGHAASASSTYSPGSYNPWYAFRSGQTFASYGWHAGSAVPQWLRRDFPSAKKITSYNLAGGQPYPTNWTLEGSNDGSAWTVVDTRVNGLSAIHTETGWLTVQNPAPFQFYRINITAKGSSNNPDTVSIIYLLMKEEVVSSSGVVVERDVRMALADGEGSVEDFTTTQRIVPLEMSTTSDWTRVMGSSMTGTLGGGTLAALTDGSLAEVAYTAVNNNITHDAGVAKKLRFKMCVQSNVTTSHTFVVETSADNTTWTSKFNGTIADAITAGWVSTSGEPSSYLDAGTNRYIRWRMTSYAAYQREVWLETQLTAGDPVLAVGQQFILAGPDGAMATLTPPVYDPASGKWSDGKKQIMLGWVQVESYGVTGIYQCKKGVTVELAPVGTTLPNPFIHLPIMATQGTTICPVVNNQITGVTVGGAPVRVWRID